MRSKESRSMHRGIREKRKESYRRRVRERESNSPLASKHLREIIHVYTYTGSSWTFLVLLANLIDISQFLTPTIEYPDLLRIREEERGRRALSLSCPVQREETHRASRLVLFSQRLRISYLLTSLLLPLCCCFNLSSTLNSIGGDSNHPHLPLTVATLSLSLSHKHTTIHTHTWPLTHVHTLSLSLHSPPQSRNITSTSYGGGRLSWVDSRMCRYMCMYVSMAVCLCEMQISICILYYTSR